MDTFIEDYIKIIDTVTADPGIKIADVPLMSEAVKVEMLENFTGVLDYDF